MWSTRQKARRAPRASPRRESQHIVLGLSHPSTSSRSASGSLAYAAPRVRRIRTARPAVLRANALSVVFRAAASWISFILFRSARRGSSEAAVSRSSTARAMMKRSSTAIEDPSRLSFLELVDPLMRAPHGAAEQHHQNGDHGECQQKKPRSQPHVGRRAGLRACPTAECLQTLARRSQRLAQRSVAPPDWWR